MTKSLRVADSGPIERKILLLRGHRAFIRLREAIAHHRDLATKLDALERKRDRQFKVVFDAIRALMDPPRKRKRRIGFRLNPNR